MACSIVGSSERTDVQDRAVERLHAKAGAFFEIVEPLLMGVIRSSDARFSHVGRSFNYFPLVQCMSRVVTGY